jgi:hypothetical protein
MKLRVSLPGCTNPVYQVDSDLTYALGLYNEPTGYHYFTYRAITTDVTILSTELVVDFNVFSFCGFDDWEFNKPKSILGAVCEGTTMAGLGESIFGKIQLNLDQEPVTLQSSPITTVGYQPWGPAHPLSEVTHTRQ